MITSDDNNDNRYLIQYRYSDGISYKAGRYLYHYLTLSPNLHLRRFWFGNTVDTHFLKYAKKTILSIG